MYLHTNSNLNRASAIFRTTNPCIAKFSSILSETQLSIISNSNIANSNVLYIGNNASHKEAYIAINQDKVLSFTDSNIYINTLTNVDGPVIAFNFGSFNNRWNDIYLSGRQFHINNAVMNYELSQYYETNDLSFLDKHNDGFIAITAESLKIIHVDDFYSTFTTGPTGTKIKYYDENNQIISDINFTYYSTLSLKQGSNMFFSENNVLAIANNLGLASCNARLPFATSNQFINLMNNTSNYLSSYAHKVSSNIYSKIEVSSNILSSNLNYLNITASNNIKTYMDDIHIKVTTTSNELFSIVNQHYASLSNSVADTSNSIFTYIVGNINLNSYSNNQIAYLRQTREQSYSNVNQLFQDIDKNIIETNLNSSNYLHILTSNKFDFYKLFSISPYRDTASNMIRSIASNIYEDVSNITNNVYELNNYESNFISYKNSVVLSNIINASNSTIHLLRLKEFANGQSNTLINNNIYAGNLLVSNLISIGNIQPYYNERFDLGSSTHRWKELYLSGNSIHLKNIVLSQNSNGIVIKKENTEELSELHASSLNLKDTTKNSTKSINFTSHKNNIMNVVDNIQYTTDSLQEEGENLYCTSERIGIIAEASNLDSQESANKIYDDTIFYINSLDIDKISKGTSNQLFYNDKFESDLFINGELKAENLNVIGSETIIRSSTFNAKQLSIKTSNHVIPSLSIVNYSHNDLLQLYSNNLHLITIDYACKIGIGTREPQADIDVYGNILLSGNINDVTSNEFICLEDVACNIQQQIDNTYIKLHNYSSNVSNVFVTKYLPDAYSNIIISSNTIISNLNIIDYSQSNIIKNTCNFIITYMNPIIVTKDNEIKLLIKNNIIQYKLYQNPPSSLINNFNYVDYDNDFGDYWQLDNDSNKRYYIKASSYYPINGIWYPQNAFNYDDGNDANGETIWYSAALYYLQNGSYNGYQNTTYNNVNYSGEWLQIKLPQAKLIKKYLLAVNSEGASDVFSSVASPRNFVLLASNDGINWVLLDEQTDINWTTNNLSMLFSINNSNSYYIYRIVCNIVNAHPQYNFFYRTDCFGILDWKLYETEELPLTIGKEIDSSNLVKHVSDLYTDIISQFYDDYLLNDGTYIDTYMSNYVEYNSNIIHTLSMSMSNDIENTLVNLINSRWNVSDTNNIYFTGNVGIGTHSISTALSVQGDILFSGNINNISKEKINHIYGLTHPLQPQIDNINVDNIKKLTNNFASNLIVTFDNITSNIKQYDDKTSEQIWFNSNQFTQDTNSISSFMNTFKLSPWFDVNNNIYTNQNVGIGTSYIKSENKLEIYDGDLLLTNGNIKHKYIGKGPSNLEPSIWYKFDTIPYNTNTLTYNSINDANTIGPKYDMQLSSILNKVDYMLVWYRFNDNSTNMLLDSSGKLDFYGNNYNLQYPPQSQYNANWPAFSSTSETQIEGNGCVNFYNEKLQYLIIPTLRISDAENNFTFAFWVQFIHDYSRDYTYTIFSLADNSNNQNIRVEIKQTRKIKFIIKTINNIAETELPDVLNDGRWYHIVWYININSNIVTWKIYLDGTLKYTNDSAIFAGGGSILTKNYFGTSNLTNYFWGYLDDFRFYQSALTENEISTLSKYNSNTSLTRTIGYTYNSYAYQNAYLWNNDIIFKYSDNVQMQNLLNTFHYNGFSIHFLVRITNVLILVEIFSIINIYGSIIRIYCENGLLYFKVGSSFVSTTITSNMFHIIDLTCIISNGEIILEMYVNGVYSVYQNNKTISVYDGFLFNVSSSSLSAYLKQSSSTVSVTLQDFRVYSFPLTKEHISSLQTGSTSYGYSGIFTDNYQIERWQDSASYPDGMRYITYNEGNAGIRISTPSTLLHVGSFTSSSSGSYRYFNNSSTSIQSTSTINNSCAIFDSSIIVKDKIISSSDERIKTNIIDIDDDTALNKLLCIEPKTYNYIDVNRGANTVYGFIAQQIADVIPEAVTTQKNIIPDIFCIAECSEDTIQFQNNILSYSLLPFVTKLYIILMNGKSNIYTVVDVNDNTNIIKVDKAIDGKKVFVYGREVDDFHTLDKSYIYTINVCATQRLSQKIDILFRRIAYIEHIYGLKYEQK